jgi:hypothetical protein
VGCFQVRLLIYLGDLDWLSVQMTDLKRLLAQINPFSSRHETSGNRDEEEFKLPNMASLVIMISMNLLLQVRHRYQALCNCLSLLRAS